jgi:uncharacterized protein
MSPNSSPLRVNVGFLTRQAAGFRRDFLIELPHLFLQPDLTLEDFRMQLAISRTPQGLLAEAKISAGAILECVRCLDTFKQPLHASFTELYAFTDRSLSESGLMYPDSGLIDFTDLVREYLILEIPISPVCKTDCLGLCSICGENRNHVQCGHEESNEADVQVNFLELNFGDLV